jgi:hypothetical protein
MYITHTSQVENTPVKVYISPIGSTDPFTVTFNHEVFIHLNLKEMLRLMYEVETCLNEWEEKTSQEILELQKETP